MAKEQKKNRIFITGVDSLDGFIEAIIADTTLDDAEQRAENDEVSTILELEIKVVAVHKKGAWTREVVK
jgi:hypothetical protein